jgi:hypothetical protein
MYFLPTLSLCWTRFYCILLYKLVCVGSFKFFEDFSSPILHIYKQSSKFSLFTELVNIFKEMNIISQQFCQTMYIVFWNILYIKNISHIWPCQNWEIFWCLINIFPPVELYRTVPLQPYMFRTCSGSCLMRAQGSLWGAKLGGILGLHLFKC